LKRCVRRENESVFVLIFVPETIFVDENGNQVGESYIGSRSMAQWKEIIDGLMENM